MKAFIALLLVAAVGCNQNSDSWVPSRAPEIITDSGIFVFLETESPVINENAREIIETDWLETQDCLGMFSEKPPVAIVVENVGAWLRNRLIQPKISDPRGHALYDENIIIIRNDISENRYTWRHEFIHIIQHQNGVDPALNSSHNPEYIWLCIRFR